MRGRLYGALGLSAGVTAASVLVTEATEGQCSIICTWQIPLVVIGTGAAVAFLLVAAWIAAYEVKRVAGRRAS